MTIQRHSYIRKYLFIFSILFLLSSCDIIDSITDVFKGNDDTNLSEQQEQALSTVLSVQDDASDIMENLFTSGLDTLSVIDSLAIFFLSDTSIQNVWPDSEGVAVEYNNGISGGIFIRRYNPTINSTAKISRSLLNIPTNNISYSVANGVNNPPVERKSIYFDGAYSYWEFKDRNDEIISTANSSFEKIGVAPFDKYLDNNASINVLSTLDQYGIIHLTGHGWNRYYHGIGNNTSYKKETYLLTGEIATLNNTYSELWADILNKKVVIVSQGKENRYWVNSKFVSERNDFTNKNVFIYNGFCWGFRENWQTDLIQNAGAKSLVGHYRAVWSNYEMEWTKKMYTSLCDTSLDTPMTVGKCISDIVNGNRGMYDVRRSMYDPHDYIYMENAGDQNHTLWEKDILNGSVEYFLDKVVTDRSSSRGIKEFVSLWGSSGIFSNNVFNGNYNNLILGRTYSGIVNITFNDNPESINFHLNGQYSYQSLFGFGTVEFKYSVDYDGIPYQGLEGANHVYSATGRAVQSGHFTWSEKNSQWKEELISVDCGDGAYIRVEVDRRE